MQERAHRLLTPVVAAAALACSLPATALASGSSIALNGPHAIKYGTPFHFTASGRASGRANYVYGWEVAYGSTCATSSKAEARRTGKQPFVRRSLAREQRFSFAIEFFAKSVARHRLCAYVIEKASGRTLARGQATWRSLAPTLEPAALGGGECGARRFPDGSVYAQVATSGMTCEVLESVAFGADAAQGGSYARAGLACTGTAEGAGTPWASAWSGTYYSYACTSGNELAAFNWGAHYTYSPPSTLPLVKPGA